MEFSNARIDNAGGVIQTQEYIDLFLTAASTSQTVFICPIGQKYQVKEVRTVFGTASTSGTATVEYLTGTTAPGSGVAQTAAIALSGTVNTVAVTNPLTAVRTLSTGDRLNVILAGTMTGLAQALLQITMIRIS